MLRAKQTIGRYHTGDRGGYQRIWGFCWKRLSQFFIPPKQKSRWTGNQLSMPTYFVNGHAFSRYGRKLNNSYERSLDWWVTSLCILRLLQNVCVHVISTPVAGLAMVQCYIPPVFVAEWMSDSCLRDDVTPLVGRSACWNFPTGCCSSKSNNRLQMCY